MNNHYHLLIETPEANLSKGMHVLNSNFCHYLNRRIGQVGHVTQGRYVSRLVKNDKDLFGLYRYILLNPVKDGFVHSPDQWKWSSFSATAGLLPRPLWLEIDFTLSLFSSGQVAAHKAFADFIQEGLEEATKRRETLEDAFQDPGCIFDKRTRIIAIGKALDYGFSVREIATYLKVHQSTIYRALNT